MRRDHAVEKYSTSPQNYRPISLLSATNKIAEGIQHQTEEFGISLSLKKHCQEARRKDEAARANIYHFIDRKSELNIREKTTQIELISILTQIQYGQQQTLHRQENVTLGCAVDSPCHVRAQSYFQVPGTPSTVISTNIPNRNFLYCFGIKNKV